MTSIKEKAYALAAEHGIELYVAPKYKNDSRVFLISLPKGFLLPDGTTGLGGEYDFNLSDYQNWKYILADVQDVVEQKSSWREVVGA